MGVDDVGPERSGCVSLPRPSEAQPTLQPAPGWVEPHALKLEEAGNLREAELLRAGPRRAASGCGPGRGGTGGPCLFHTTH